MRFKVPPRDTEPPPERSPVELMVTDEFASCVFVIVPERRFAPIVVVETTFPVLSVPRSALVSAVKYVFPVLVKSVVEAFASCVKPVKVEEACEIRPDWNVWRALQMFADARSCAFPTRQVPFTAKQPDAMLKPVP